MADALFDLHALAAILLISAVSAVIFRREALSPAGINGITECAFYLALCVSIAWLAYTFTTVSGTGELGERLSFCLMLLLYAALLRLIGILAARFKKSGKPSGG